MAQEAKRQQITGQIVCQRYIDEPQAARMVAAQGFGCSAEPAANWKLARAVRPGLCIFDVRFVLVPVTAILDALL